MKQQTEILTVCLHCLHAAYGVVFSNKMKSTLFPGRSIIIAFSSLSFFLINPHFYTLITTFGVVDGGPLKLYTYQNRGSEASSFPGPQGRARPS